jgi:phospholipid-binding lipoprotein MlaA
MKHYLCYLVLLSLLLLSGGCATVPEESSVDPFEPVNRAVFAFNDGLDKVALRPLAKGYAAITPTPMRRGIRNFFANLKDLTGALNASLQFRFAEAGRNSSRFLLNSTIGMLGFADFASDLGIAPYRTDFGHTLATWGVESGPYLMVPFFGPRTVRSGMGSMVDAVSSVQWQLDTNTRNALLGLEIIDNRAALINVDGLITGDRYIFVRDAYLQQREYLINGEIVDDFFLAIEESEEWDEEWN